ncbi:MAG: trigger factor [Actinomycetaceae bacterium]|nr:trigger factor [Actinomycetaceae bacterium]
MKTTAERLEPTKVKLTVEVPYTELNDAMDKAYKKLSQQVNVPGFRRGHVPKAIIDQRIGRAYVIEEAINDKLGDFYAQAIKEEDVIPMDRPEVDVTETPSVTGKLEGQLVFTAQVTCQPEFELPSLDGVELEIESSEVSLDDVEEELDKLRDRFSSLIGVDRAVEEGDYTSIDMVAEIDGEQVDSVSGVSYQQGSDTMLPGLDEALIGMSEEETKTFETEFVGGEHAGEKGQATVTVKKVKVKELPEADDDFAMMASEFDTIGDLRADIRENLEKQRKDSLGMQAVDKLRTYLIDTIDIELPEDLISQQLADERYADADDEKKAEIEKSLRETLKTDIVLDKVARESEAELEQQELLETIMQVSQMYGIQPQQLMQSQEQVSSIAAQLTQNKALALMLKQVTVKDEQGATVDLEDFIKRAEGVKPSEDDTDTDGADQDKE